MALATKRNWEGAQNPYNLAEPPDWWLDKLYERDPELRVFPGLTQPCYRIGRRTPRAALLKPVALESETNRMMKAGCVPVVSLRPDTTWNLDFFQWLDDHDTWTEGGGVEDSIEKYAQKLDRNEEAVTARHTRAADSELDARSTSAYFASLVRRRSLAFVREQQGSST